MLDSIVYPTSSDPPTLGHVDILKRAAASATKVWWVIANNADKGIEFSLDERLSMMQHYVREFNLKNVELDNFAGSVVRYAKNKQARFLLRGLRNATDFQYEITLAHCNRGISSEIETICLFADPKYSIISSSLVRELARLDEDFSIYVIPSVAEIIKQHYLTKAT